MLKDQSSLFEKKIQTVPPLIRGGQEGFSFIPYNPKLKIYARQNRKNSTFAEMKMWHLLSRKQFADLKFTRQKPIENFIIDFYCSKLLLAIEIDGETHDDQEKYDAVRSDILKIKYKIEVVRYPNSEVLRNTEGVYEDLLLCVSKRKQFLSRTKTPF